MKITNLSIYFTSGPLFVLATVDNLTSFEDAQAVLAGEPRLSRDIGEYSLWSDNRLVRVLSEHDGDEFGCWPDGADRNLQEDYWNALISFDQFLNVDPDPARMQAEWWQITENALDGNGRFRSIIRHASGHIGKCGVTQ